MRHESSEEDDDDDDDEDENDSDIDEPPAADLESQIITDDGTNIETPSNQRSSRSITHLTYSETNLVDLSDLMVAAKTTTLWAPPPSSSCGLQRLEVPPKGQHSEDRPSRRHLQHRHQHVSERQQQYQQLRSKYQGENSTRPQASSCSNRIT